MPRPARSRCRCRPAPPPAAIARSAGRAPRRVSRSTGDPRRRQATSWPCAVRCATRTVRNADALPTSGRVMAHQAVALEPQQRRMRAAPIAEQRIDAHRLRPVASCLEDLAPRAALGQHPRRAGVGDPRVPLALDPGPRRHRRADRFAGAAGVVLGHPRRQRDDVRPAGTPRRPGRRRCPCAAALGRRPVSVGARSTTPGDDARAERHEDAGADRPDRRSRRGRDR